MCTAEVKARIKDEFLNRGFTAVKRDTFRLEPNAAGFAPQASIQTSGGHGEVLVLLSAGVYHDLFREIVNAILPKWWSPELPAIGANYAFLEKAHGLDKTAWIFRCDEPERWSLMVADLMDSYYKVCLPWIEACSSWTGICRESNDGRFGLARFVHPIALSLNGRFDEAMAQAMSAPGYGRHEGFTRLIDGIRAKGRDHFERLAIELSIAFD